MVELEHFVRPGGGFRAGFPMRSIRYDVDIISNNQQMNALSVSGGRPIEVFQINTMLNQGWRFARRPSSWVDIDQANTNSS